MAEDQGNAAAIQEEPSKAAGGPHGTEAPKDDTDWKAEARKWEARAKDNKSAAEELDKLKKAQMSDLEKAQAEADAAKAEAAKLKAEKARAEAVKAAAQAAGVDAELLELMAGDTPEQISANAETLKAKIAALPAYPSVEDNGAAGKPAVTKEQIEKIKNPVERVNAIAKNPGLFK